MRLKPRKKNSWEHGYEGEEQPEKFYVPQGKVI